MQMTVKERIALYAQHIYILDAGIVEDDQGGVCATYHQSIDYHGVSSVCIRDTANSISYCTSQSD